MTYPTRKEFNSMATEVSANTKKIAQQIVNTLEKSKDKKLTKGEIAVHVSCSSSEWGAAIAYLTALGAINAEGEKRGKRYGFVKKL